MAFLFLILFAIFVIGYRYFSFPKQVDYKQKHVVIIGGSEGIGKDVALRFLKEGAKVTIVSRSIDKLKGAVIDLIATSKVSEKQCNYYSRSIVGQSLYLRI